MGGQLLRHRGGNYLMEVVHLQIHFLHAFKTSMKHTLFIWALSSSREYSNFFVQGLLVSAWLLCWIRKERLPCPFNLLFFLGVKYVGGVIEVWSRRILESIEVGLLLCIFSYYVYLIQQNIILIQVPSPIQTE